jgi:hypothetical protein
MSELATEFPAESERAQRFSDIRQQPQARMSAKIFRREALLRSFRWCFLILGLQRVVSAAASIVAPAADLPAGVDLERYRVIIMCVGLLGLVIGVIGFIALSKVRTWTRKYLVFVCGLMALGTVPRLILMLSEPPADPMVWVAVAAGLVELGMVLLVTLLAFLGSGKTVYGGRGTNYLPQTSHLLRETPWVGVGYALVMVGLITLEVLN